MGEGKVEEEEEEQEQWEEEEQSWEGWEGWEGSGEYGALPSGPPIRYEVVTMAGDMLKPRFGRSIWLDLPRSAQVHDMYALLTAEVGLRAEEIRLMTAQREKFLEPSAFLAKCTKREAKREAKTSFWQSGQERGQQNVVEGGEGDHRLLYVSDSILLRRHLRLLPAVWTLANHSLFPAAFREMTLQLLLARQCLRKTHTSIGGLNDHMLGCILQFLSHDVVYTSGAASSVCYFCRHYCEKCLPHSYCSICQCVVPPSLLTPDPNDSATITCIECAASASPLTIGDVISACSRAGAGHGSNMGEGKVEEEEQEQWDEEEQSWEGWEAERARSTACLS
jgi:hypothetical protein